MTRTLYLQCDHGISGDMVVGALLDLGAHEEGLRNAMASLNVDGYHIEIGRKRAGAMDGCDFDVVMDCEHQNHDHDMEWLFGTDEMAHGHDHDVHAHGQHHAHDHTHDHDHAHLHDHHAHGHDHVHRNLADIRAIIRQSQLSDRAQKIALDIFMVIALAEAKAHGETVDTVHFHEVGAVDSIVDVAAVAWCLDDLNIEDGVVSPLAEGEGHIRCAHGVLPIPVPAVAHIVEAHGLVLKRAHRMGELVTPTGAAIAAILGTKDALPEKYRLVASGLGTGKRAYDPPSVLRALLVEEVEEAAAPQQDVVWKLETEVDDCTGEALGYTLDRLYRAGAREAHFIPVFMKKGRPGYQIEVLCGKEDIPVLEEVLFNETTTIGIRRTSMQRTALVREQGKTQTPYGDVRTKRVVLPSGAVREYLEHDSVAELAAKANVSYQTVLRSHGTRGAQ